MKVKLRTQYAGPSGSHSPGSVADFDKAEAYALIEGGYAEQVDDLSSSTEVETADLPPPRTAEAPANKRRKRP